jgi:photoactive yellow protein
MPMLDVATLAGLARASVADLESAPFGAIIVDREGTIERYNAYEAELAQLAPERVIGKNFFHHVAPCTAVAAFEGRFLEFLELDEPVSEGFAYFFPFAHGDASVLVTFVKRENADSVLIVIERVDRAAIAPIADIYSPIVPRQPG